ncbi:MAG: hypothetical protein KJ995_05780 [Candidatus Omnitrophica bacterium]|nr:hypothetical protein [Candidatus Omnitrophota bacterium]MBU1128085.1 hypothetical protein [Candidatus Omnitrophota bacterium]MBU1851897.1 hypothetical protein [Candidatus Omnitrophota bacterium]
MELKNLDKLPDGAGKVLTPYLEKLLKIFMNDIVSVFAYGSVTGPDYNAKRSDISIAVILKDASCRTLRPALKLLRSGLKKKIIVPLFLTRKYIEMSMDTFPMEFMEMRDTQLILFGEDVLEKITVTDEDIRRECEYQIKGKLLTLRQAYLEQALRPKALERLIKTAMRVLFPVFRSVLRIKSGKAPSLDKAEILRGLSEELGIDVDPFLAVLRDGRADGRIGTHSAELFIDAFVAQLERLSNAVDEM